MSKVALVAWREFKYTALTRTFILGAVVFPLAVWGIMPVIIALTQQTVRPLRGTAEHAASVECRTWASERCLTALARRVGRSSLRSVEVFEPSVSPRDLTFDRRRIAAFEPLTSSR